VCVLCGTEIILTHKKLARQEMQQFTRNYIRDFVEGFNGYLLVESEKDAGRTRERKICIKL
jgi:hypothetical protein